MALTVFAEKMGFFHKGCAGIGVAPVDVCLSPPPGPVPIPYTNVLFAKDLIKGSKTVFIDGEPTFLEDLSETSTSIGDEGGTLGGSVVTGVILGKGYFLVWSMTVQIEGLGVCRHGDMMGQNSASHPFSSADAGSVCKPGEVAAQQPGPVAGRRAAEAQVLEGTGPGNSKPPVAKPCCFDKVTMKCAHTGSGEGKRGFGPFEWTFNGAIQDNLPKPKDGSAKGPIGLIAGHSDKDGDTLEIKLEGGPGYTCGKNHPLIQVIDLETMEDVICEKGVIGAGVKLTSRKAEMPSFNYMDPSAILNYFWFPSKTTARYQVLAASCGVQADKSPGFARLSRAIEVHSSDVYKFSLSIPDVFNRKYAKNRTRPPGANWQDNPDVKPEELGWDQGMRDRSDWHGDANASGERPIKLPAKEIGGSLQFTRNGENISAATDKLSEIIENIKKVVDFCQATFNFISDFQPQLGWKFDFSIAFLAGSLSFEWGTKEANSHAVYNWWKFSAGLTLVSLGVEASFGFSVKGWGCKLEVVGFLKGEGKLELNDEIEATPDNWTWHPPKLSADLAFEGGVRAAVGADWVASGEGKVGISFPYEAQPRIDKKEGFKIDWKWERSDCKAHVIGRVFLFGSIDKEYVLIKKGTIGSGTFPQGTKKAPGVPSPSGTIPP